MSLRKPDVQRVGDDFLYTYGVQGIRLEVSGITDSRREGFHGWLTVKSNGGKLSWGRLKFDSTRERNALAKDLLGAIPDFPWSDALAQVAEMTYEGFRAGEPTVRLCDVPAPPTPPYLADPLLPLHETTILYGDSDAGKSTLALFISLCVAMGYEGPGFTLPKQGPVLYADWETNAETHARRLRRLQEGMGLPGPVEVHYRRVQRPVTEEARVLQHEIHRLGVVLVVIDSLGFCMGTGAGESINDANVATGAMNALRSLGVTRLALHHLSHEAVKNGGSSAPTGSRYFRNAARCLWEIDRSPISPQLAHVGLYNRKMNDDSKRESPIAWALDYGHHRGAPISIESCELAADPHLLAKQPLADQIAEYLKKARSPLTIGDLQKLTGKSDEGIRRALRASPRFAELSDRRGFPGGSLWGLADNRQGLPE